MSGAALERLRKDQSLCLAGMAALCLPSEDQAFGTWRITILRNIVDCLDMPTDYWQVLLPLIDPEEEEVNAVTRKEEQSKAFAAALFPSPDGVSQEDHSKEDVKYEEERYMAVRKLLISFALVPGLYDARTRSLVMRLAGQLNVQWNQLARVEALVASFLHDFWVVTAIEAGKEKRSRYWRYAKIGAGAVVGGTLLGLTGGLAAPAIAAGLSATGLTAGFAGIGLSTSTLVATLPTLFGVGGSALVGSKVKRRVEGIRQFEFRRMSSDHERGKSGAKMCIAICVSGWIVENEGECETSWGLESETDALERRLVQFLSTQNPAAVPQAVEMVANFSDNREALEEECILKYGASPFGEAQTANAESCSSVGMAEQEEVLKLIQDQAARNAGREKVIIEPVHARQEGGDKMKQVYKTREGIQDGAASVGSASTIEAADRIQEMRKSRVLKQHQSSHESDEAPESQASHIRPDILTNTQAQEDIAGSVVQPSGSLWWHKDMPFYETFTLHWENAALKALGRSVDEMIHSIGQTAAKEFLSYTAAATLLAALSWPLAVISCADLIDGTWTIAAQKADQAGTLLAEVLLKRDFGVRPVVLCGFSMGARVIFSCLVTLAKVQAEWHSKCEALRREGKTEEEWPANPAGGIVFAAVLLGAPVPVDKAAFRKARSVVAHRLVNCYSKKDWVIGLIYRYQRMSLSAAGYSATRVRGVEDCDVSHIIGGHQEYNLKLRECLAAVNLEDVGPP